MKTERKSRVRAVAVIGVLSAISAVLMLIEIPLFFAPEFYKLDLSDTVALIGGFVLGPGAAVLFELLKNLLHILFKGTQTAFVGEMANFLIGCVFTVPASLVYKAKKNRVSSLLGMTVGTLLLAAFGSMLNYFVLIPAYSYYFGLPLETIVEAGRAINPRITDLKMLIVWAVVPFNLVKGVIDSVITGLLYRRLSPILRPKE